ncbi:transposable element Tcb1 transposase [Trichonephila clavipes]|nr:transposable element Tcb1 transposase [Trichonephila clavipes]
MSSRHYIDDFMRGRIIGKIEEGRNITDVAREFDIAHSVVSRLWKPFKTTGMCSRRQGEVVLEVRCVQEDRYIVLSAKGTDAPQLSRWQISFFLPQESRSPEKLLHRRLKGGGLYARRPVVCIPLTRQHRSTRFAMVS